MLEKVEVKITRKYCHIQVDKSTEFFTLIRKESTHFKGQNGYFWELKLEETIIGLFFNALYPDLLQACLVNHRNQQYNTLQIPLSAASSSTEMIFWNRKIPYRRSTYWKNKIAVAKTL